MVGAASSWLAGRWSEVLQFCLQQAAGGALQQHRELDNFNDPHHIKIFAPK